jgi:hypothetical protein
MNKPLVLFIISLILLIFVALLYNRYCKSHPNECKKTHRSIDSDELGPKKGIDW